MIREPKLADYFFQVGLPLSSTLVECRGTYDTISGILFLILKCRGYTSPGIFLLATVNNALSRKDLF